MKRTKKMLMVVALLLVTTTLVSAALLQYFGKVTTSMNVQQSIVIGDQQGWYNWNQPVERNFGEVIHCTDYCYKLLIKNQACRDAEVSFLDECVIAPVEDDSAGISIYHYVFGDDQTVELRQKDTETWEVINEENIGADITFNTCGITFDYDIAYWGIQGEYSLVYYLDHYPRFEDWGHVFVIANFELGGSGNTDGTADIPTLPFKNDWNAAPPADYSDAPDFYEHANGAKLWLVPTENLVNSEPLTETTLISWTPTYYLFETDLILYIDCDNWAPYCLPYVYPIFDTVILKAETQYCWISCFHVAFDIVPGQYIFDTYVNAVEIPEIV